MDKRKQHSGPGELRGIKFFDEKDETRTVLTVAKTALEETMKLLVTAADHPRTVIHTIRGKILVERGEALVGAPFLARAIGVSVPTMHKYLGLLQKFGFLENVISHGPMGSLLRVRHFPKYLKAFSGGEGVTEVARRETNPQ